MKIMEGTILNSFLILLIKTFEVKDINLPIVLLISFSIISSPFYLARAYAKIKSKRKNK